MYAIILLHVNLDESLINSNRQKSMELIDMETGESRKTMSSKECRDGWIGVALWFKGQRLIEDYHGEMNVVSLKTVVISFECDIYRVVQKKHNF